MEIIAAVIGLIGTIIIGGMGIIYRNQNKMIEKNTKDIEVIKNNHLHHIEKSLVKIETILNERLPHSK